MLDNRAVFTWFNPKLLCDKDVQNEYQECEIFHKENYFNFHKLLKTDNKCGLSLSKLVYLVLT